MGTDMLSLPRGRLGASWALWSLVGECCVMLIPYFDVAVESWELVDLVRMDLPTMTCDTRMQVQVSGG
jgi:hypothetical protein